LKRTKIICTLGPATNTYEKISELITNGMDAARLNFSHGTYDTHSVIIENLKKAREDLGRPIPLILDTKGPEIRIKTFADNKKISLEPGKKFTLTSADIEGDENRVSITYAGLCEKLEKGSRVLIDDGLVELKVLSATDTDIECEVVNGGIISSNKGVNVPGVHVDLPVITEKDKSDLLFGIKNDFDYVAASFIRNAADVLEIRSVLEENGGDGILIISKIETREGVKNIDEILAVSDGIMVARGDLGVEMPIDEVPIIQKELIKKANALCKPAITATQMLDSMMNNPRPTRAEANDVANAIFDGSDAIMLSGETASGKYPAEAVKIMSKIAATTESAINYEKRLASQLAFTNRNMINAISYAACTTAADLGASCIATVTKSGLTARMIAKYKPSCPIAASSFTERVWRQLNLIWGCSPVLCEKIASDSQVFSLAVETAKKSGLANDGDTVVIAVGVPVGVSGSTNTMRVATVGDVVFKGKGIGQKPVSAKAVVANIYQEAVSGFMSGDILVTSKADKNMLPFIKRASAVVVGPVDNAENSYAEIACTALDIPAVISTLNVTDIIKNNTIITVDPENGFVYFGAHQ